MRATAKDLRLHTKRLLEAVERGEEVVITYRGRPSARLVPPQTAVREACREDALFGLWKDHGEAEDVEQFVGNLRRSRF